MTNSLGRDAVSKLIGDMNAAAVVLSSETTVVRQALAEGEWSLAASYAERARLAFDRWLEAMTEAHQEAWLMQHSDG